MSTNHTRSKAVPQTNVLLAEAPKTVSGRRPTISDFMKIIGQSMKGLKRSDLAHYSDHDVLRLSTRWAEIAGADRLFNKEACVEHAKSVITQALSSECAKIEVEAIALLSELEWSDEGSSRMIENDDQDDGLTLELAALDAGKKLLSKELAIVEELHSELSAIVVDPSNNCGSSDTFSKHAKFTNTSVGSKTNDYYRARRDTELRTEHDDRVVHCISVKRESSECC